MRDHRVPLDPGGSRWLIPITATGPVAVRAVQRVDGAVICAGEFAGTLAIGDVRARSAGGRDGFVARLDGAGRPTWVKTIGGPGDDRLTALAASATAIAIGGEAGGPIESDGATIAPAAGLDGFVGEVAPGDGAVAWLAALGSTRYSGVTSVAFSGTDVIAAGQFAGSLAAAAEPIYSAGNQDLFVARYAGGSLAWLRRAGGPGADVAASVAVGRGGAIVFAGTVMDGAAFGATVFETIGEEPDAVVGRLSGAGAVEWVKQLGGPGYDSAAAVAVAGDQIAAVGRFARQLLGAGEPLDAAGSTDGFVVRLSLAGEPLRSARLGGAGADWLAAVAAGSDTGDLVIGGGFAGRLDASLQSAGGVDGLVSRLAGTQRRWQRNMGGAGDEAVTAVAIGARGDVAVAGSFSTRVTIDGIALDAGDQVGGFVALLEP